MPLWQAFVLGIVQGLTEFLPISSTAHLLLVQKWFGRTQEQINKDPFTVVVQLGTLFAVLVYFRRDIVQIVRAFLADIARGYFIASISAESRLAKLIAIGTIPAGIIGLKFKKPLEEHFRNPTSIAIVAIVFACVMFLSEWWAKRRKDPARETVTLFDAIFIGIFQAFALMPGGSRSGCTITAGLFAGLSRPAAARFSFLLSLPVMIAAGLKESYDWAKGIDWNHPPASLSQDLTALLVGTLTAAVVGYLSIAWLLGYLRKYSMNAFVVYRILLGIAILTLVALNLI